MTALRSKSKAGARALWYFTIELGSSGGQGRIKRRGFRTKKDAETAERAMLNEIQQGLNLNAGKTPYCEFMKDCIQDKKL
ncbi:Arm DNA-binding domain-containing protein [Paenibacillus endophyticus]|uniref:Arm DNA-binding domain-containing protein n=1 Tax=Paenibacillus endophyticus TaxID=1294268 RepID=UPI0035E42090